MSFLSSVAATVIFALLVMPQYVIVALLVMPRYVIVALTFSVLPLRFSPYNWSCHNTHAKLQSRLFLSDRLSPPQPESLCTRPIHPTHPMHRRKAAA